MTFADDYRRYAMECLRLAHDASDPDDKARLLQMAQAWYDLADKIAATAANDPRLPSDRDE
ncbi:MAG: hypothetical protein HYX37_10170 [Rhizobiales bacterium]|nr:hypothetical protein [Hyphomicrobiales bacterium]